LESLRLPPTAADTYKLPTICTHTDGFEITSTLVK